MKSDNHGNVIAREGATRCACGCKYWENDRCIDCGDKPRCECGNPLNQDNDESKCDWCMNPECEIIVEVDGVASGTRISTCEFDGRPIFRSHMAGTIYHATEDR